MVISEPLICCYLVSPFTFNPVSCAFQILKSNYFFNFSCLAHKKQEYKRHIDILFAYSLPPSALVLLFACFSLFRSKCIKHGRQPFVSSRSLAAPSMALQTMPCRVPSEAIRLTLSPSHWSPPISHYRYRFASLPTFPSLQPRELFYWILSAYFSVPCLAPFIPCMS